MALLLWPGIVMSLAGVCILIWCIVAAFRAKRMGLGDEAMRARLKTLTAVNMAALGLSALGLMAVITGLSLG